MRSLFGVFTILILTSVSAQAKSVRFSGEVSQKSVAQLIASIQKYQARGEAVEVFFDSGGGDLAAALNAFPIIRDMRVSTYTSRNCSSACTVLYAAGIRRRASSGAQFMFHQVGVKVKKGDKSSDNKSRYREIYAAAWLDVVRSIAPALANELEARHVMIDGERTYKGRELLSTGYVNER